jgi:2-polyprenyl-3-methyl-5-hydroxy-6-metoxy-1,4-benzoquinol methylase
MQERVELEDYRRVGPDSSFRNRVRYSTARDHQARYSFAADLIRASEPQVVIDASSGSGWGSDHLAKTTGAKQVIGIDVDDDVVSNAEARFSSPNLLFTQSDLSSQGSLDNVPTADWLVSLETIEHITPEFIPAFLYNLRQAVKPDGKLILSTPNRELFSPYHEIEGKPWYEHHTKEFVPEELADTMRDNGWQMLQIYGQRFVNRKIYLGLAGIWYAARFLGQKLNLSSNHRITRLPIDLLNVGSATVTSGELEKTDVKGAKNAIYVTGIFEQVRR